MTQVDKVHNVIQEVCYTSTLSHEDPPGELRLGVSVNKVICQISTISYRIPFS